MSNFQKEKSLVRLFYQELEAASAEKAEGVLERFTAKDYHWRGMHPFYEQHGAAAVAAAATGGTTTAANTTKETVRMSSLAVLSFFFFHAF